MALLGGELAVDSRLGQGSNFHPDLTLPAPESATQTPLRHRKQALQGPRVLIVDDSPLARQVMTRMWLSLGRQVEAVLGGAEAIATPIARTEPDTAPIEAIIVDWQMSDMDGWQTNGRPHQAHARLHQIYG